MGLAYLLARDLSNSFGRLRSVGEQIKCQLSSRPKAVVQVQEIAYGAGGQPLDLSFTLTAEEIARSIASVR